MEQKLFRELQVYREQGYYLRRVEQYEKAAAAYEQAFQNCQDDIRLLLGRSQVCADAGMPQEAFEAADLALKLEPMNMNAINMQARAMYTMTDFEKSIVMNSRGRRIRKQPAYFNEGFIQGLETLQHCVGKNAGNVLLDNLPIIIQHEGLLEDKTEPCTNTHKSRIPKKEVKVRLSQLEEHQHELLSRVMAMKYLGPMAADKFFLQNLLADPRMKSTNVVRSRELTKIVEEALQKLSETQEMMRTQRPYYSIKKAETSKSRYLTQYKEVCLEKERNAGHMYAERRLKEIHKCLAQRRIKDLMTKAVRLQAFLSSKTPRTLPDQKEFTNKLYKAIGDGYLSQYRISPYSSERHTHKRILFLMGLRGRPKSYDSVVDHYPFHLNDVNVTVQKMISDLDVCENGYMRCWLNFEISKLLYSQKNFSLAKFYGQRCQRQAAELDCAIWWLNGCFILMGGEMQQGNTHEVELIIEESRKWIKTLPLDTFSQIEAFMAKCLEIITYTILLPVEHQIERQREEDILRVLDEKSREETLVLFKRIRAVPDGRRFSVLPKKQEPLRMTCTRRKPGLRSNVSVVRLWT